MKFLINTQDSITEHITPTNPIQVLDEVDELSKSIEENLKQEINIPSDVLNSFKIKDNLNPNIWPDGQLNPKIKPKLLKMANDFIKDINLPKNTKIKDILLTGSLANYNWSKFSDVDLHILLDFNQFDADPQIIDDYFYAQRMLWNQEHDIKIFDYPVEIFMQNTNEKSDAGAIYSILKDKWIVKPKYENFKLDNNKVKTKVNIIIDKLKDIRDDYKDKQYQRVVDKIVKLKDKIKQMRKSGLESGGEYSLENIVFKVLRRTPFMDILDSFKAKAYDSLMSVNEIIDEGPQATPNGILLIKGQKQPDGTQRLYATLTKNIRPMDRTKKDDSLAQSAMMVNFGNNPVFRVSITNGRLTANKVAWQSQDSMLAILGLSNPTLSLNDNKTPMHWETLKFDNLAKCFNTLQSSIAGIPNIKWVG